jgi:hypothetical protein
MPMCRIGDEEANRRKEKRRSEVRNSCVREYSDIPYCSNYADTVVQ